MARCQINVCAAFVWPPLIVILILAANLVDFVDRIECQLNIGWMLESLEMVCTIHGSITYHKNSNIFTCNLKILNIVTFEQVSGVARTT